MRGNRNTKIRLARGRYTEAFSSDPLARVIRRLAETLPEEPLKPENENFQLEGPSPSEGLMDIQRMKQRTVLIPGVGAVGSRNALLLAPYGMTQIQIDPDIVEWRNVVDGRTIYTKKDIHKHKVYALQEKITSIYPDTKVIALPRNVHDFSMLELVHWAQQAQIALVGIDEGPAILKLNEVFYSRMMVIYQGVHRRGESGQLIITRPGSPCLKCCMNIQTGHEVETLHRESGLGIHFSAIAQLGVQIVVQELAARDGSTLGSPLKPEVSLLYISNMASELTPQGPGIVPFAVQHNPACEICGNYSGRR